METQLIIIGVGLVVYLFKLEQKISRIETVVYENKNKLSEIWRIIKPNNY